MYLIVLSSKDAILTGERPIMEGKETVTCKGILTSRVSAEYAAEGVYPDYFGSTWGDRRTDIPEVKVQAALDMFFGEPQKNFDIPVTSIAFIEQLN